MAVRVVLTHEHHYGVRRLWRGLLALAGVALTTVGVIASAIAIPLGFGLLVAFALTQQGQAAARDRAMASVPWGQLVPLAGWSLLAAIVATIVGLRLVRGRRGLILFLRRFGYAQATTAVTLAARSSLSRTWRVVTLDDAQVAPVGLPIATRTAVVAGSAASAGLRRVAHPVVVTYKLVARQWWLWIVLLVAFPINDVLTAPNAVKLDRLKAYGAIVSDLIGPHRLPPFAWDLHTGFVATLVVLALILAGVLGTLVALIGAFLMLGPWSAVTGIASGMAKAEQAKRLEITTDEQVEPAVFELAFKSESVFAPKLAVVRVHSSIWRRAVQQFAQVAAAALVDVSAPSQHLLWELRQLREGGTAVVLVGQFDRVIRLTEDRIEQERSVIGLLAREIDGQTILAYRLGKRGLRVFARELADALETAAASELGWRKHHAWAASYLKSARFRSRFPGPPSTGRGSP